jgi:hypothetical protein
MRDPALRDKLREKYRYLEEEGYRLEAPDR